MRPPAFAMAAQMATTTILAIHTVRGLSSGVFKLPPRGSAHPLGAAPGAVATAAAPGSLSLEGGNTPAAAARARRRSRRSDTGRQSTARNHAPALRPR